MIVIYIMFITMICVIFGLTYKIRCLIKERNRLLGIVMSAPLLRSLNYQDIVQKLITVEELPQGAYARFEPGFVNRVYDPV